MYVCGEESAAQTKLRAQRIGAEPDLLVFAETNLRAVLDALEREPPQILVIDSIQTMWTERAEAAPGTVTQVRGSAQALIRYAKRSGAAVILVGHVTKDGQIAGPRVVDRAECHRTGRPQRLSPGAARAALDRFEHGRIVEGVPGLARRAAAEPTGGFETARRAEIG